MAVSKNTVNPAVLKKVLGGLKLGEVRGLDPPLCANVNSRVKNIDRKKVLLPQACNSGSGVVYSVDMQLAVLKDHSAHLLVTGETGTGKEVLAQYALKHEDEKKCRSVNCAGLQNQELADSELFGHAEGAFTGARGDRIGLVKECENGVLFLDEIGWLPQPTQAKLLRFMETGEFRRVGDNVIRTAANVRIIAATNKSVTGSESVMIHDLVHRFDHHIILPPLRERGADILWLLPKPGFLGNSKEFDSISLRALLALMHAPWEGNVRDLQKFIKRKALQASCSQNSSRVFDTPGLFSQQDHSGWPLFAKALLQHVLSTVPHDQLDPRALCLLDDVAKWGAQSAQSMPSYCGHCFTIKDLHLHLFSSLADPIGFSCLQQAWNSLFPYEVIEFVPHFEFQNCADWASAFHVLCLAYRFIREKNARLQPSGTIPRTKAIPPLSSFFANTPAPEANFEEVLAETDLPEKDKEICRRLRGKVPGRKIARDLKLSQNYANTLRLRILDDYPDLAPFIPKGKRGRPLNKMTKVNCQ